MGTATDVIINVTGQPAMVFRNAQAVDPTDLSGVNTMNMGEAKSMLFALDYGKRVTDQSTVVEEQNLQLDTLHDVVTNEIPAMEQATPAGTAPRPKVTDWLQLGLGGMLPVGALTLRVQYGWGTGGGRLTADIDMAAGVRLTPLDYQSPPSSNEFALSSNPPGSSSLVDGNAYERPDGTWFYYTGGSEIGFVPDVPSSGAQPPQIVTGPALAPTVWTDARLDDPNDHTTWPKVQSIFLPQWMDSARQVESSLSEVSTTQQNFLQQLGDKYQQFCQMYKNFVEVGKHTEEKIVGNF